MPEEKDSKSKRSIFVTDKGRVINTIDELQPGDLLTLESYCNGMFKCTEAAYVKVILMQARSGMRERGSPVVKDAIAVRNYRKLHNKCPLCDRKVK